MTKFSTLNKTQILQACLSLLDQKQKGLQAAIRQIQDSMLNETKSSSGDKHETARAKMQSEQANLGDQLFEIEKQLNTLNKIDPAINHTQVQIGACFQTQQAMFFMALGLGKIAINQGFVFVISPASPLGQKMMGAQVGQNILFSDTNYLIEKIS